MDLQILNSPSAVPNVDPMSPPLSLPTHLNSSFLFPSKQSSPPQELIETPPPPKKQEVSLPPPPQKIAKISHEGQQEEGEAAPNPKEEEHILAVEEKSADPRALSTKQATGEPSVLLSTSPLSSSSAEEEFDLSNSMSKGERNHGGQVTDQEDTMEEVEHLQQDSHEVVYLSDLEDCFDGEEPVEFPPFSLSSSTFQTQEFAVMKENIHLQQPASYNSSSESRLEDFNLSCSSLEEEKGQRNFTISSTPSIQGLQENSILGVEN